MKRRIKGGDEQDVYTRWRSVLAWTKRAGAVKKIKKRTHKRERQEGKAEIKSSLEILFDHVNSSPNTYTNNTKN